MFKLRRSVSLGQSRSSGHYAALLSNVQVNRFMNALDKKADPAFHKSACPAFWNAMIRFEVYELKADPAPADHQFPSGLTLNHEIAE